MSDTKLPNELSIEDLLKLIEGQENKKKNKVDFEDPILSFIQTFDLKTGNNKVHSKVLFDLFLIWYPTTAITLINFSKRLAYYLPSIKYGNANHFLLNKNSLLITSAIEQKKHNDTRYKSRHFHRRFNKFLQQTGLNSGSVFIEVDILYYAYNNWCDKTDKIPLQFKVFVEICELFFKKKVIKNISIPLFGLNEVIKTLITKEQVENWRQGRSRNVKEKFQKVKRKSIIYQDK